MVDRYGAVDNVAAELDRNQERTVGLVVQNSEAGTVVVAEDFAVALEALGRSGQRRGLLEYFVEGRRRLEEGFRS